MEFKSLKNIETSFRQLRLFGMVFLGGMRTGNGLRHLKGIRVCRGAAAENLCVGQRKIADAGTFAGRAAEPPRGSEGTYQTFPRTVFHPVTGQERH